MRRRQCSNCASVLIERHFSRQATNSYVWTLWHLRDETSYFLPECRLFQPSFHQVFLLQLVFIRLSFSYEHISSCRGTTECLIFSSAKPDLSMNWTKSVSTTAHQNSTSKLLISSFVPAAFDGVSQLQRTHFPITLLPTEVQLTILKYLRRYDIDNCKFVCRHWREMIMRNSHSLRKHTVYELSLSAQKSRFTLLMR